MKTKEQIKYFITKWGELGFLKLIIAPFINLLLMPRYFIKSLFNCRVLLFKKWNHYNMFFPYSALTQMAYWKEFVNIQHYGRHGISKVMGTGKYKLSNFFHMTSISLRIFHNWGGAATVFIGMFVWLLSHLIWFYSQNINLAFGLIALIIVLFSTNFYVNLFIRQNYNVLGWMFFPIGLYGVLTGRYFLAALSWLAISFLSFTVTYLVVWITLVITLIKADILVFISILPALVKIGTHFLPILLEGTLKKSIVNIGKIIGSFKESKYKRPLRLRLPTTYMAITWAIFCILLYLWGRPVVGLEPWQQAILISLSIIMCFSNMLISRVADEQTLHMLFFSLSLPFMLCQNSILLLIAYWIVLSPSPILFIIQGRGDYILSVPECKPFRVKELLNKLSNFLSDTPKGSRVLFCWNDPKDEYENVYDGYLSLNEPLLYAASCKDILVFPNEQAICENNFEGAPGFWGRDLASVQENINKWNANFIIIYQKSGTNLDHIWEENGFEQIGFFSWEKFRDEEGITEPLANNELIDWWLLKPPSQ